MQIEKFVRRAALLGAALIGIATATVAQAGEVPPAKGTAIFTVGGKVGNWNRGAVDEKRDGFFKHHEVNFDKAISFDRDMLDKLEQGTVKAHPPQIAQPGTFTGPKLTALLKAAGVTDPQALTLMALDGYAVELTKEDLSKDWILAAAVDGKSLTIGAQGPLWLVRTPEGGIVPEDEEEQRWVWAAFFMSVD